MTADDPTGPIFPRVRTTAFVDACRAIEGMTEENMPVTRPMAGDLCLAYGADTGPTFWFVSQGLARRRGLDDLALFGEAMENLGTAAQAMSVKNLGPAFQVEIPNDLSAASYYLEAFWEDMRRQLKAKPVAAFGHRNFVAFCAMGNEEGIAFLRHSAAKASALDNNGLSSELFVWQNRWFTWDEASREAGKRPLRRSLEHCLPDLDAKGQITFPCRMVCAVCDADVFLEKDLVASTFEARQKAWKRPTTLQGEEGIAFLGVERQLERDPSHFVVDTRCQSCDAPAIVQLEGSRGLLGARYRALQAFGVE